MWAKLVKDRQKPQYFWYMMMTIVDMTGRRVARSRMSTCLRWRAAVVSFAFCIHRAVGLEKERDMYV